MTVPQSSSGRLVDAWPGGTGRDPSAVVAEFRSRAPHWLRSQVRPMTHAEQRLWRYLGDRLWMGADVFSQVPVYIPEANRGFVLGFLVPARGIAVEVVPPRPGQSLGALAGAMEQDDLMRDKARIATIRCLEPTVLRHAQAVAEGIRWTLGLDEGGANCHGIKVPRT